MNQPNRYPQMKKEIKTEEDIKALVDSFYSKVSEDKLLGPVFNEEAGVDWDKHLPQMYKFWGTQLIGTANYSGQPFPPHMRLKITKNHFERWVELFKSTIDEHFQGLTAEMAKQKANNIANVFQWKLGIFEEKK
jgi:hemoglobin